MLNKGFRKPYRALAVAAIAAGVLSAGCGQQYVLFHPAGPVGQSELNLMVLATIAMAVVVIPVWIFAAIALIKFRDNPRHKGVFTPKWQHSRVFEILLWAVPMAIIAVIAVPTVQKTYALDRLPPAKDPVVIDVTSLDWKWLFQYPGQHIATVNYIKIPVGEPVLFELTADSPMNTFWVPQLGGMEYNMSGMVLPLWLQADKPGTYLGRSGQFSGGAGFAHMTFQVEAVPKAQFEQWLSQVKATEPAMSLAGYHALLKYNTVGQETFSSYPQGIFPTKTHGFTLRGTMQMGNGPAMVMPSPMP